LLMSHRLQAERAEFVRHQPDFISTAPAFVKLPPVSLVAPFVLNEQGDVVGIGVALAPRFALDEQDIETARRASR
jgi:hypothetical protein